MAEPNVSTAVSGQGTSTTMRLNKFLAERLGISRREADDLIAAGKISVNGHRATLGERVDFGIDKKDEVCYNGKIGELHLSEGAQSAVEVRDQRVVILPEVQYIYLALNKPVGYVCSRKRQGEVPTLYELLPAKYASLKTVGRLDRDSEGLILLTNDGNFAYQMTHPKFVKTKVYEVQLDRALEPLHQQMIADFGVDLADGRSQLGLERLDDTRKHWRVTMSEGRNRQIRRTFGALGYTVLALKRTDFGKYHLAGLKPGEYAEVAS